MRHPWGALLFPFQIEGKRFSTAEGPAARRLRELRPTLFEHPLVRQLYPDEPGAPLHPGRLPLAGDDLYNTEEFFQEYSDGANQFIADIASHFDSHGDEYYPHSGQPGVPAGGQTGSAAEWPVVRPLESIGGKGYPKWIHLEFKTYPASGRP